MFKASSFTFLTRVFNAFLGLLVAIITARTLGAHGRGVYSFLENMLNLAMLFGSFGAGAANVYFLGKKKHPFEILFWNSILLGIIGGIISIAGVAVLKGVSSNIFQQIHPGFIWITALLFPVAVIIYLLWNLLLGLQKIFSFNIVPIVSRSIFVAAIAVFLIVSPRVITALFVLAATTVFWLFLLLLELRRAAPFGKPRFNFGAMKEMVKFGIITQPWTALQFLNARLGIFLINFFLNPLAVGVYSISFLAGEVLGYSSNSLATVLLPKISASANGIDSEKSINKSCRLNLLFVAVGGAILFFISPLIIKILFGQDFLSGLNAFRIFIIGAFVVSLSNILSSYFIGRGMPKYPTIASLAALAVSLSANMILIPKAGISGSAIATVISYFVLTIILVYFYKKNSSSFSFSALLIPRVQDIRDLLSSSINLLKSFKLLLWQRKKF